MNATPVRTGRRRGHRERAMVPEAEFTSYYGRPIVKPSPWGPDIPAYLFLGGLAGASSLLAAGADLSGNGALRRPARVTALAAILGSFAALVHDLGRPARFHHMLRVAKVTSPMSVGSWILVAYAPMAGLAAAAEFRRLLPGRLGSGRVLPGLGRAAGVVAALLGPAVASYTAVLLTDTATPSWHEGRRDMPFVFVGSAAAAAGGMGMLRTPVTHARAARRMAVGGAMLDLAMSARMESAMGLSAEPMRQGTAGRFRTAARALTATGAVLGARGRASEPGGIVPGGDRAAGRFGVHAVRHLSCRPAVRTRSPLHRGTSTRTPPAELTATGSSTSYESPPGHPASRCPPHRGRRGVPRPRRPAPPAGATSPRAP
ncbi:NrfD/PsrC family molybdoenzyme membrane anchor subunit [Pseudonocardia sp. N23]|uniref:NrfD/PsrC family molybdoenzyme membrane anchor subunit n=1 Tax=Pseudonocardia sp. N23 TaxID=1987376 RepID=UPI000C032F99|nr:NrfD/PsrC family molybdoenzyme membrane anchor subunit [Pseudonocardia sp. N23]GAY08696.1 formate dehydrogenase O putative subunit [Pseudonocardia sp. N23]